MLITRGSLSFFEKKFTKGLKIYANIAAKIKGDKIARSANRNQIPKTKRKIIKIVLALTI